MPEQLYFRAVMPNEGKYLVEYNVRFNHSHGGMQPHVHVYTWHQGPNGCWNSSRSCVAYDPALYPGP